MNLPRKEKKKPIQLISNNPNLKSNLAKKKKSIADQQSNNEIIKFISV
jgi:hypothetical protein